MILSNFKKINIVCIEKDIKSLKILVTILKSLETNIHIHECTNIEDSKLIVENLYKNKELLGLIITNELIKQKTKNDFLKEIYDDIRFFDTKKILILSEIITQEKAIEAKKEYLIDEFIQKPFKIEHLLAKVKYLLTLYIVENNLPKQLYATLLN